MIGETFHIDKFPIECYNVTRSISEVKNMAHISLRVTEQEREWIKGYADLHCMNVSEAVKMAFFERLEDEYDLIALRDCEKDTSKDLLSLDDTFKELGILD
jgi:hypothetical protein